MLVIPIQPTLVSAYHRCACIVCRTASAFVSQGSKRVKTTTLSFKLNYGCTEREVLVKGRCQRDAGDVTKECRGRD